MEFSLPLSVTRAQARAGEKTHPAPRTISTPTGEWSFLRGLGTEAYLREDTPHISYSEVEGVEVKRFSHAMGEEDAALLAERLMSAAPKDADSLGASHFRRITAGLLITVKGVAPEPLVIAHRFQEGRAAYRNTVIVLAPGAECTIIETFEGDPGLSSHVCEAYAGDGSRLVYANTQATSGVFLARRAAEVGRDASVDWFELNANERETSSRIASRLEGENASARVLSIYLGDGAARIDFSASAEHAAPRTASSLSTHGVLSRGAKAIYEGTLRIGRDAPKSEAFQEEDCLLLDNGSEVRASPMLYIDNNDVKCGHAATAGHLDSEKLFYLESRGLARADAERLLIKAFVWPAVEALGTAAACKIDPYVEPIVERFAARGEDAANQEQ